MLAILVVACRWCIPLVLEPFQRCFLDWTAKHTLRATSIEDIVVECVEDVVGLENVPLDLELAVVMGSMDSVLLTAAINQACARVCSATTPSSRRSSFDIGKKRNRNPPNGHLKVRDLLGCGTVADLIGVVSRIYEV